MSEHESPHKVKPGDDYKYPIKGSREASYKIDSRRYLKMKYMLYVPGLNNNIVPISTLDAKGMRVEFVDAQFRMWPKGKTINDATLIGEKDRGLYKLKGRPRKALVHESIEPSEL